MLPKQLKFGSKVESAAAKSSRVNIAPQNGTNGYNLGDTIIFNIPTRQNLVLVPNESYLKFNLNAINNTVAAAATSVYRWDSCGAHGVIGRIRVFHGSNMIQDIDNYNLLSKMLFDIQVPADAAYGKLNLLAGTRNDLVVQTPAAAQSGIAIVSTSYASTANDTTVTQLANAAINTAINNATLGLNAVTLPVLQVNSGDLIKCSTGTAAVVQGASTVASTTYCLNLKCVLGTLCSQNYFPLFACTSAPIRLEITLVSDLFKAMNCTTVPGAFPNGILSNVEYIANFIELGDSAMSVVAGSLQGQPLQFVVPDYRNYQFSYSLAANPTTQVSMAIPAKFSSLKSLFVTVRDQGTGAITYFPFSSITAGIVDYQFRIGSSIFPPKAVNTLPEMFAEVIKSMGSMSDLNYQPSIAKTPYSLAASTALTVANELNFSSAVGSGSFYIGIDLENYVNANNDNIFAGWNSNTDDIFAIMNFTRGAGVQPIRFDAFAMFDSCLVFRMVRVMFVIK